ncbi:hypothetical protein [Candidatus Pantoea persica]|uniref:hypothetical protein n=1 Tax=Candidatus Pantoea persica TaxID=2518128 RepID=UPI00215D739E|nr:hypothetical protein [Candidatus Pantoea persica]
MRTISRWVKPVTSAVAPQNSDQMLAAQRRGGPAAEKAEGAVADKKTSKQDAHAGVVDMQIAFNQRRHHRQGGAVEVVEHASEKQQQRDDETVAFKHGGVLR